MIATLFALIAALGVLGILAVALSQPDSKSYEKHNQQKPSTGQKDTQTGTNEDSQNNTQDGGQYQKAPNYWERFIAFVEKNEKFVTSLSTAVIAAFTLALVGATIALFVSSERVARHAGKSAEIAERALIAGQRAFISVSFDPIAIRDHKTGLITQWGFRPTWGNSGETPTRGLINHINLHLFEGDIPDDWDFPDLWAKGIFPDQKRSIPLSAPAKGSSIGQELGLSLDQVKEVIAGTKSAYMWGWAKYADVFPNTEAHVTRFAIQIRAGGDPTTIDKVTFRFPNLARYNCSDEECESQGYSAEWVPRELEVE